MGSVFPGTSSERLGEIALQIKILQLLFHRRSKFSSVVAAPPTHPIEEGGGCLEGRSLQSILFQSACIYNCC